MVQWNGLAIFCVSAGGILLAVILGMIIHAKVRPNSITVQTYAAHGDLLVWSAGAGIIVIGVGIGIARLAALGLWD